MLADEDLAKLQAAFDTCDMKVRGGLGKWAALSFEPYPGNHTCSLIEQRADAADACGNTVLHVRVRSRRACERCTWPVHGPHPRRLPGSRAQTVCRSGSRPISRCRQPHACRAMPDGQKIPETPPRQYRSASPLWEMSSPNSQPTIDHRASGPEVIRTIGQAPHSVSKSANAHAVY